MSSSFGAGGRTSARGGALIDHPKAHPRGPTRVSMPARGWPGQAPPRPTKRPVQRSNVSGPAQQHVLPAMFTEQARHLWHVGTARWHKNAANPRPAARSSESRRTRVAAARVVPAATGSCLPPMRPVNDRERARSSVNNVRMPLSPSA